MNPGDFEEAASPFGGLLHLHPDDPNASIFERERGRAQFYLSTAYQAVPGLPLIEFGFINNSGLNAFACRTKENYCIGLNAGVLTILRTLFGRAFANPKLFRDLGNPDQEVEIPAVSEDLLLDPNALESSGIAFAWPRNTEREIYCQRMIDFAVSFLVAHELTHIANGHVDYLNSTIGTPFLAEFEAGSSSAEQKLIRQVLEMDADAMGTCDCVGSVINRSPHSIGGSAPVIETANLVNQRLFAADSVFRLFGGDRFLVGDLCSSFYPPTGLRARMMGATGFSYLIKKGRDDVLAELKKRNSYIVSTLEMFSAVTGEPPILGWVHDGSSEQSREHMNRLTGYWTEKLRTDLLPFAFSPLPD